MQLKSPSDSYDGRANDCQSKVRVTRPFCDTATRQRPENVRGIVFELLVSQHYWPNYEVPFEKCPNLIVQMVSPLTGVHQRVPNAACGPCHIFGLETHLEVSVQAGAAA